MCFVGVFYSLICSYFACNEDMQYLNHANGKQSSRYIRSYKSTMIFKLQTLSLYRRQICKRNHTFQKIKTRALIYRHIISSYTYDQHEMFSIFDICSTVSTLENDEVARSKYPFKLTISFLRNTSTLICTFKDQNMKR